MTAHQSQVLEIAVRLQTALERVAITPAAIAEARLHRELAELRESAERAVAKIRGRAS